MKNEIIEEKYQTELKWASYYLISSFIISFVYTVFQFVIFNQSEQTSVVLLLLNFLILLYCSFKCLAEIKLLKNVSFISKLGTVLNIFIISYLLINLFHINIDSLSSNVFLIPQKELEIQTTAKEISDTNSNLLKDFIAFLKRKR